MHLSVPVCGQWAADQFRLVIGQRHFTTLATLVRSIANFGADHHPPPPPPLMADGIHQPNPLDEVISQPRHHSMMRRDWRRSDMTFSSGECIRQIARNPLGRKKKNEVVVVVRGVVGVAVIVFIEEEGGGIEGCQIESISESVNIYMSSRARLSLSLWLAYIFLKIHIFCGIKRFQIYNVYV